MKIAILGAGVGGLSTVIALKKKGFNVDIYERHSMMSDIGAGIVCWPNASFVFDKLGMLDDIKKVSGLPTRMRRLTDQGESLGSLNILDLNQTMGYPSYSILRKDLMRILTAHANNLGIEVKYHCEIKNITSTPNGRSQVHLANSNMIEADVIIGADGRMNSIARKYVNGNNTPVYQGFINWTGVFQGSKKIFKEVMISDYWGIGERFGIVPISDSTAYWAGAVAVPEIGDKAPLTDKNDLNSVFQHWPDPIATIINESPLNRINKIYVHDHHPIDVWHKNNVLLIGDAAHAPLPTSGQGACQALEDAWHLAELLANHCTDLEAAFQKFTKIRLSKTTGITRGARQFAASLFNTDPEFCRQRNINSKATDYHALVKGMAKGWADGLPSGEDGGLR